MGTLTSKGATVVSNFLLKVKYLGDAIGIPRK